MKRNEKQQIAFYIFIISAVLVALGILMAILLKKDLFRIIGVLLASGFGLVSILSFLNSLPVNEQAINKQTKLVFQNEKIKEKFESLYNNPIYPETSNAKYLNSGLEYKIHGKFFIKENFNEIKGHHFAIQIESDESKDEFYDFSLQIGYFDDFPLTTPENENGIIFDNLEKLEDKTILLSQDSGYIFQLITAEFDDVDFGEIKIINYTGETLLIQFKIKVPAIECDVLVGTVNLKKDTKNYD